ncbi:MAG: hypothetical protein ACP5IL_10955 [Syntrophobacteraceae bacterium]
MELANITMPLLNIYARYDHLVPPGACNLLTKRVASTDTMDLCIDTGHIGIYVSSKSQQQFTPKIVEWLKKREVGPQSQPLPKELKKSKRRKEVAAVTKASPGKTQVQVQSSHA